MFQNKFPNTAERKEIYDVILLIRWQCGRIAPFLRDYLIESTEIIVHSPYRIRHEVSVDHVPDVVLALAVELRQFLDGGLHSPCSGDGGEDGPYLGGCHFTVPDLLGQEAEHIGEKFPHYFLVLFHLRIVFHFKKNFIFAYPYVTIANSHHPSGLLALGR